MDTAGTRFGALAQDRDDLAVQVQNVFKKFLEETGAKYSDEALKILDDNRNTLFIDFKDIELFDSNLAESIICEYGRFYPYLCRAMASYVREEKIRKAEAEIGPDVDVSQRMIEREKVKKELDRPATRNKNYYVGFYNFAHRENIRDLSSTKIGTLTRVSGQVIRTHSVHPELIIGCFKCADCMSEQYTEQQFRYTQPINCINENCNNRTRFNLELENCQFTDFQRLRIQETQQELPRGCIPRSFDVVIRGADQVECIQPGDQCDFVGTLIAIPDVGQMMSGIIGTVSSEMAADSGVTGLKSLGVKDMTYTLAFLANSCIVEGQLKPCINTDESYRESAIGSGSDSKEFTEEEVERIHKMTEDRNLLSNLSQSLFSSIYGSEDVKRGIILQLLGGVPKITSTGTKLRGDINICLVGDPSTAKSQFLKVVTDFAPVKAVYASGKASSASGLTAAVVRDSDGGFVIEAGALMLADRGICCIDEFDKMDLNDQVAIHEAMEQQTISITKAGVTATLNARTSILAAANPVGGTYDTSRDLKSNVGFSLPIMSRFDLFFIIIDPLEEQNDRCIADRIVDMHLNYGNSNDIVRHMVYPFEDIRLYLKFARKYYPRIPVECEPVLVQEYVRLRANSEKSRTAWRFTVRQLESLIRLSEAMARAHCSEVVKPEYIKEASRLIERTIVYVGKAEVDLSDEQTALVNGKDQAQTGGDQSQGLYDGELESQRLEPSQPTAQKLTISVEAYKAMFEVLKIRMLQESEREDSDVPALRRSELVDWYLHQCVGEIATELELIKRKQLCEKVLDRLIKRDQVILELKDDGQIIDPSSLASPDALEDVDRLIILNPNYAEDEDFFSQANP